MFKGKRFTPAMIVAMIALAVALSGTAVAGTAKLITGSQIANGTIKLAHLNKSTKAALKGDRGATGAQGAVGAQGAQGLRPARRAPPAQRAPRAPRATTGIKGDKGGKDGKDATDDASPRRRLRGYQRQCRYDARWRPVRPYPDSSWRRFGHVQRLNGRTLDAITQLSYTVSTRRWTTVRSHRRTCGSSCRTVTTSVFERRSVRPTVPAEDCRHHEVTTATKLATTTTRAVLDRSADVGRRRCRPWFGSHQWHLRDDRLGGAPISALLRTSKVNGTEYTFGAA